MMLAAYDEIFDRMHHIRIGNSDTSDVYWFATGGTDARIDGKTPNTFAAKQMRTDERWRLMDDIETDGTFKAFHRLPIKEEAWIQRQCSHDVEVTTACVYVLWWSCDVM